MTKRTRYFLVGSAAVLVLGLCTGLVAYYGGALPSLSAARGGPAELSYVPASAAIVAYANVRDVMTSQFRERVRELVPEHERGQDQFQKETGIDIERDIDHVVACMLAREGDGGGLVVANGRFDVARLETLAREHGGAVEDYKGKRLVLTSHMSKTHESGDLAGKRGALAFLETGIVAIGDEMSIKSAIDAAMSGQSVTGNDEMMRLVDGIETGASAWAVGRFDALATKARLPEEVSRQIPSLKWFAATTRIDGGVSGELKAEAMDEQAAENLRDVIRGFFALARMQASSNPKYQAMVQALQLSGTGTTVAVSFTVPTEVIDALSKIGKAGRQ
jgi:hypothetical protein